MISFKMHNPTTCGKSFPGQNMNKWLCRQSVKSVRKGGKLKKEKAKWFVTGLEHFSCLSRSISKGFNNYFVSVLICVHHCYMHLLSSI